MPANGNDISGHRKQMDEKWIGNFFPFPCGNIKAIEIVKQQKNKRTE